MRIVLAALLAMALSAPAHAQSADAQAAEQAKAFSRLDPIFARFAAERHTPGLVFGVVADGKLAYVRASGVQDTAIATLARGRVVATGVGTPFES